jgi:hypothetical protein
MGDELLGDLNKTAGLPGTNNWIFDPDGVGILFSDMYPDRVANYSYCNRLYATKFKDLKNPLIVTYTIFLIVSICYATLHATDSYNRAQYGFAVLAGIGQSGPLTLILALVQFSAPHAFIATASGFALSCRAIGGAFGSAVLDAIINGKLAAHLGPKVGAAAIQAGLPKASVPALLEAIATGEFDDVDGLNAKVLGAALDASHAVYAEAYRVAWASIIPFVVLAIVAVCFIHQVKEQMTDHVEASVEKATLQEKDTRA